MYNSTFYKEENLEFSSSEANKDYLAAESFSLSHRLKVSIETRFSFATASAFLAMLSSRAI